MVGSWLAEQGEIARPPEAEDIGVRADLLGPVRVQLLRGRVVQRARDGAADHRPVQAGSPGLRILDQAAPQRQAEVDDLDLPAPRRLADEQVGRLDVAVPDARLMGRLEGLRRLDGDRQQVVGRQRPVPVDVVFQGEAVGEVLDLQVGPLLPVSSAKPQSSRRTIPGVFQAVRGSGPRGRWWRRPGRCPAASKVLMTTCRSL